MNKAGYFNASKGFIFVSDDLGIPGSKVGLSL